jgi:hypothetical protein
MPYSRQLFNGKAVSFDRLKNLYATAPFADRYLKVDVTLPRAAPAAAGRPIDLVTNYVTLSLATVVADIINYDFTFAEKDCVVGKAFPKKLCRDIIDAMQRMSYSRQLFNGKAVAFDRLKNLYAPPPFADRYLKVDVTLPRAAPAAAGRNKHIYNHASSSQKLPLSHQ